MGAMILCGVMAILAATPPETPMLFETPPGRHYTFEGLLGERTRANLDGWLLRAPAANPGMIDMFNRRDRHLPYDPLVPWAGEFAGKYLIAAVQAKRMSKDKRLDPHLKQFVKTLLSTQASDGYLGPFPEARRLQGEWDLWGHYHVMLGLVMWHQISKDQAALDAALKAADLIATLYGEGERRPIEAGAPECNFAVMHVLGKLYRMTGRERYLEVMRRIEQDMPQAGDWLESGLKNLPYHQLQNNGIRWESLHALQGLVEMYRITGEDRYKTSVLNLWRSLRDFDRHPSGAFSTSEGAIGTIYKAGAIETCCSIAWLELTTDVLRMSADATVADELELTTYNQALAAQHPAGSWCTYDTPMNGVRRPAFHHINFQYRPGTPELNCCSVNAPRGLGIIPDWAIMEDSEGLVVNFFAPGQTTIKMKNGKQVRLTQETDYPLDGEVRLKVQCDRPTYLNLRMRVPAWARSATMTVDGRTVKVETGSYASISREWREEMEVTLKLDWQPRVMAGKGDYEGKAALMLGPLLLAYDTAYNSTELSALDALPFDTLRLERLPAMEGLPPGQPAPLGLWRATHADRTVVLCDFASAGASGTEYAAWMPYAPPTP